jgi:DNA-binding beta-propeller fold protein YncE
MPSLFVRPGGEAVIVAQRFSDDMLIYFWATPGSPWHSTQVAVGDCTPGARFVRPDGETDIVAQALDNSLMYYWATPGSPWQSTQVNSTRKPMPCCAVNSPSPQTSNLRPAADKSVDDHQQP